LTWLRISTNAYDYGVEIEIPEMNGHTTVGLSYLWNIYTTPEIISKVTDLALRNNVKYIRLIPDCTVATEQLEEAHIKMHKLAQQFGPPWFHQYKIHRQPAECHLGRTHPVLYTDGLIYPCDSLVLNAPQDDRRFDAKFSLCRWDEIGEFMDRPITGTLLDTDLCPHCIFTRQNEIITDIINGKELEVPTDVLEHVNFV
jgi:hypothetical protein